MKNLLFSVKRDGKNATLELAEIFTVMFDCCSDGFSTRSSVNELLRLSSAMFRGRIRWNILFIEALFVKQLHRLVILLKRNSNPHRLELACYGGFAHVSSKDVKDVAKSLKDGSESILQQQSRYVQTQIIDQLQLRIVVLQQKGHHYLLEDLFATAVRADLMHNPCIFRNPESAQMVTEGFALLRPSTTDAAELKQELAEPLAVDAVIEYLRRPENEKEHRYERYFQELLYHSQDDDSAFGKAAEFYIGWVC